jgi:hypothetical protein
MNAKRKSISDGLVIGLISGGVSGGIVGVYGDRFFLAFFGLLFIGAVAGIFIGGHSIGIFRERGWLGGMAVGAVSTLMVITSVMPLALLSSILNPGSIHLDLSQVLFGVTAWIFFGGLAGGIYERELWKSSTVFTPSLPKLGVQVD